ncbi:MAG TPA: redoxin domain-containing protein [Candidatus Baltobacteraceae bacterium]|jgi:peroxiredoxin Q/BCP
MLSQGDQLPNVTVLDDTGASVDTAGLLGKPLVLWFYPKDDTPG